MVENKVLDKVRKLHAKAESAKAIGSEHEAQAFAAMVNRLLNEHRLSMTDLEFEEERKTAPVGQAEVDWEGNEIRVRSSRVEWIESLARVVARAHSCSFLVRRGSSRIWMVGTQSNREIAEYLLITLVRSAEKIADAEYVKFFYECKERGEVERARGFRSAFLHGFISRLDARFDEEKAKTATSTALVRIDKSMEDVREYLKNPNFTASKALSRNVKNMDGLRKGRQVADSVDLRANAMRNGGAAKELR